jgi:hypothetical protein
MSNTRPSWFKWSIIGVALAAMAALCISVRAQDAEQPAAPNTGYVDDWTHHHVVFSNPGTREEAVRNGTLDKWTQITSDPRYKLQQLKRNLGTRPVIADQDAGFGPGGFRDDRGPRRGRPQPVLFDNEIHNDWSAPLGGGESTYTGGGPAGTITSTTVFANGSTLSIDITFFGFDFGLVNLVASNSPTCVASGGTGYPHYSPPTFCTDNDSPNNPEDVEDIVESIAAAFNATWLGQFLDMSVSPGCTASSISCSVTIANKDGRGTPIYLSIVPSSGITGFGSGETITTLAAVQPNALPAVYVSSPTTASCSADFVVYPAGQPGSSTAADIVAYNELYGANIPTNTGCGSSTINVPTAYWAYNTGTGEMVSTSPVLSLDGTQVAFVESTGSAASLVLLKWKANSTTVYSISAPDTLTATTAASYRGCAAPCMVAFSLGADSSYSAPYYDYTSDSIYVGDNSGKLHKFTNVFLSGTPAASGSPWPVAVSSNSLSSPVYDSTSGYTYVGDMGVAGNDQEASFWSVSSSGTARNVIGEAISDAIADGPLIDSSTEMVYVFLGDCISACGGTGEPGIDGVLQISIATNAPVGSLQLGTGGAGYYIYDGAFDNEYYTSDSGTPATPTGNLYAMGNTGPTGGGGTLYQVPITSGAFGTPHTASGLSANVSPWASPVTEYYNTSTSTDYIFFSLNSGTGSSCTAGPGNGCVLSFNVTSGSVQEPLGENLTNVGGNGCWVTGGISIDGSTTGETGTQNIYFVTLNGAVAGSNAGAGKIRDTSSECGTSTPASLGAIQASQSNP